MNAVLAFLVRYNSKLLWEVEQTFPKIFAHTHFTRNRDVIVGLGEPYRYACSSYEKTSYKPIFERH